MGGFSDMFTSNLRHVHFHSQVGLTLEKVVAKIKLHPQRFLDCIHKLNESKVWLLQVRCAK